MPKQTWSVADDKRLRRAVHTTQEFVRSDYDHYHVGAPGHHDDVGVTHSIVGGTAAPVGFPQNQDKFSYGFLHPSQHWAKGEMHCHAFFSTSATAGVGELSLQIDACAPGNVVGAAGDNLYAQTSKVFTPTATPDTLVEITWKTPAVSVSDYHFLTWIIGRLGSSGTDTINQDIDYYLLEIEWFPVVATA